MRTKVALSAKFKEAFKSVIPIVAIVMLLSALYVPVPAGIMLTFLCGGMLLIVGMMLFTLGAEMSVTPMGEYVGSYMTRTKKLIAVLGLSFVLGFIITISEPDLQVLASLVPSIPSRTLVLAVALGVGIFLMLALLRMLFRIPFIYMLIISYAVVFALTYFVPDSFISVAFDSGGVTTGPMTVPFIMAMGLGVAAIRSDENASDDSFGLVALCSVGPVLAVLILGMIYHPEEADIELGAIAEVSDTMELFKNFLFEFPTYLKEMAVSLSPILIFMLLFQIFVLRLKAKRLERIVIGIVYTYAGLVIFMTGANVGFMPAGRYLGGMIAEGSSVMIVPVAMIMGYFIVKAEPAVYVLNNQVERMTDGGVKAKSMGLALSIGVAVSLGLSMIMVLKGFSILYYLIPGYALALGISFFVPKMYTAIAFDSGGVASGPMTAAFLVPFAQGACIAVGGNIETDAFGIVAMVALTPLITIQLMALYSEYKERARAISEANSLFEFEHMDEDAIIPL